MNARMGFIAALLLAGGTPHTTRAAVVERMPATDGDVALANLDRLVAQQGDLPGGEELLLLRARFVADYDALLRAARIADVVADDAPSLLRRARVRAAIHRFDEALLDVRAAEAHGVPAADTLLLRASIASAQGHADGVLADLEALARDKPGYAAFGALAAAYASVGRYEDADRAFAAALGTLDTTSPFPHAWIWFARGTMWAEQAGDPARGESALRRSLGYLPGYVQANVHLAELEIARGERAGAEARLQRIAASAEPEVWALLAQLHATDPARRAAEAATARARFEALLRDLPLAFADHAAEFYLATGDDPARALELARVNFSIRQTTRARALLGRAEARVTSNSAR
jgi:tetratricopeptide (TPR) repeat protein